MVLWFNVRELPKAQPAVVLVLKRLRRWGNSLKSHPTDWEKPGIEPAKFALLQDYLSFDKNPEQIYNDKIRFLWFSMRQVSQTHDTFTTELFISSGTCNILSSRSKYCRPEPLCVVTDIHRRENERVELTLFFFVKCIQGR